MKHSYIIIDDDPNSILKTKAMADSFTNLQYAAEANSYETGLEIILEYQPKIVFMEIEPTIVGSNLSLKLINELHRYLNEIPIIIVTSKSKELAFEAIKYEIFDYFVKPIDLSNFRKAILKIEKANVRTQQEVKGDIQISGDNNEIKHSQSENLVETILTDSTEENIQDATVYDSSTEENSDPKKKIDDKPLIICVKSYGDYRFIEAKDICYLQADNNSTDIHLYNGEMITAFKTLKHFEGVLTSPFVRIHNSYIVNIDYVSRIHTGNSVCYIKNTTTKLPFSKSYKENVDSIINSITNGNYLEI